MRLLSVLLSFVVISSAVLESPCLAESRVLVPSTDEFRRNGEGALLTLNNGRLLLVYTQWYSGTGSDHDPARLVEIHSDDQGKGSYCYATMTLLNDTIHMAYYGPGGLRYQKIPLAKALYR